MQPATQFILLMTIIYCQGKVIRKNVSTKIDIGKRCECVPFLLCENGTEIIDGAGLIDVRANLKQSVIDIQRTPYECENVLEVCCEPPNIKSSELSPWMSSESNVRGCGVRNFNGVGMRIMSQQAKNEAKFGEFPWMVAVLHSTMSNLDVYRCGGSLIHRKVVLTAAHCVYNKSALDIKIRAGEWDTQSTDESLPHQDRAVEAIVIHEDYHPRSLHNDIALLILTNPVDIAENVDIACLPESNSEFDSSKCIASGWGKNNFGSDGQHQEILKIVQLYMAPPFACQRLLRRTRLGKKFILDKSFVCAGGIEGEDTCKGDGGSPLICPLRADTKRYVQVGIVSWGIGCGSDLPGVYTSITYLRSWIDEQLMYHNLDNTVYQHQMYTEVDST